MNKDCIHESENFNGIIHTKLMILKQKKPLINGVRVPRWAIVIGFLILGLLLCILGASIYLSFFGKPPAPYGENCKGRSCFPNINLKCINNTCQCLKNEYFSNKCVKKGAYMESCNRLYQCETEKGLGCFNGKCKCNTTNYWNGKLCTAKKLYGDICKSNECDDNLMLVCNSNGVCSCNEDRFWSDYACLIKRLFNEKCLSRDACNDKKELHCINNVCSCESTHYFDMNERKCVKYLGYAEFNCSTTRCKPIDNLICNTNSSANLCNCPSSSKDGMCDCIRIPGNETYWNISTQLCQNASNEFDSCQSTYECLNGMFCDNVTKICRCEDLFFYNESSHSCENQLFHSSDCEKDNACRNDLGLSCINGNCLCTNSTLRWSNNTVGCTIIKLHYSEYSCRGNYECVDGLVCNLNPTINNCNCPSVSNYGMCDCLRNLGNETYWNGTLSSCEAAKKEFDLCGNDYECLTPMHCDSSISSCTCNVNFYFNEANYTCLPKTLNSTNCNENRTCRTDLGLFCNGIKCECNITQYWYDNIIGCTDYIAYGENGCILDTECEPNKGLICNLDPNVNECNCPATSSIGLCDCQRTTISQFYWNSSTLECEPAKNYSENCNHTYECLDILVCNSTSGTCTCNSVLSHFNGTACLPKLLINESCTINETCRDDLGLTCQSGSCQCFNSSFGWYGAYVGCSEYILYGRTNCSNDTECYPNSGLFCNLNPSTNNCSCPDLSINNMCDCPYTLYNEYFWNDKGSKCLRAFNESAPCTSTHQCLRDMVCKNFKCQCGEHQYYDYTNRRCFDKTLVNTSCTANYTCRTDLGLTCISGKCQCNTNQFWLNNTFGCKTYLNYGETTCTADWQCKPNLICNLNPINNSCNCPKTSVYGMCDCKRVALWDCDRSDAETGFYWDGSKCETLERKDQSCHSTYQCLRPLSCQGGKCEDDIYQGNCYSGWYYFNGACYTKTSSNVRNSTYQSRCQSLIPGKSDVVIATSLAQVKYLRWIRNDAYIAGFTCCWDLDNSVPSRCVRIKDGCVESISCSDDKRGLCQYIP